MCTHAGRRQPRVSARTRKLSHETSKCAKERVFFFSYLVSRPEPGCNPRDMRRGTRHQTVSVASPGYPFLRVDIIPSLRRQERNHDVRSRELIIGHRYTSRDRTINATFAPRDVLQQTAAASPRRALVAIFPAG